MWREREKKSSSNPMVDDNLGMMFWSDLEHFVGIEKFLWGCLWMTSTVVIRHIMLKVSENGGQGGNGRSKPTLRIR